MFLSARRCAEHMTQLFRLKVKVMGFTLEVGVCYISSEPLESFSLNFTQMFLSVEGVQKQCLRYQYFTSSWSHFEVMGYFILQFSVWLCLNDFLKSHSNAPLIETLCRTHDSVTHSQGQAHT